MPDPDRLVALAPNWLGDIVMALPALADVRRRFPAVHLAVAARHGLAPLFRSVPGVDTVVPLDQTRRDVQTLRDARADTALLLPNSFRAAWLTWRAGIAARWGYGRDGRGLLLTEAVVPPRTHRAHHASYYQHLTTALGCEPGPLRPAFRRDAAVAEVGRRTLTAAGWAGERLVGIAPGAAYGTAKQWPPERMGRVAAGLVARHDVRVVVVGAAGDAPAAREVVRQAEACGTRAGRVIDLAGRTTLTELAGVLGQCAAFLSNDSGAMHLAAALDVPVVAIFGPTEEWATSPLPGPSGHAAIVLTEDVFCRPCMLRTCPIDHRCMARIDADRVLAAVASQLGPGDAAA